MKILIIEDDPSLRELIAQSLTNRERAVVETADNLRSALYKIEDYDYDCVLLDIMLPDGSGFTLLERLKAMKKRESVIIISARDTTDDKVAGLELGADDYLAKPFHLAELHARIRSVVPPRPHAPGGGDQRGARRGAPETFQVFVAGRELSLGRKEYGILAYFFHRPGHLINKETLAEAVWGDHVDQADNFDFVYAQMKNLRRKLTDAGATIQLKSVYGFGYKLIEDTET